MIKTQKANQRLFDKALKHIRKQGRAGVNSEGVCVYQGNEGAGCAFSPAIKKYDQKLEGRCAYDLLLNAPEVLYKWVLDCDELLANAVQDAHDCAAGYNDTDEAFLRDFESNMANIANNLKLDLNAYRSF